MIDLAQIKEKWIDERQLYERLWEYAEPVILREIKKAGILANVTYRVKDSDKLLKKALRKQYTYDEITDKLGVDRQR